MGMSVQTNLSSMFASRQVGMTTQKISKSTEKLASGFKVNRAADNAAGLAISEKLRRQVRGLSQGTVNTQDGVSLCQVADGALAEVTTMLHRMTELSIQAANDTLSPADREAIQQEISELQAEISRVGSVTSFNERPIFDDIIGTPRYHDEQLVKSKSAADGHMIDSYLASDDRYHPAAYLDFSEVDLSNIDMLDGKSFTFTCSAQCDEAFKISFDKDLTFDQSTAENLTGKVTHRYVLGTADSFTGSDIVRNIMNLVKKYPPETYDEDEDGSIKVSHSNEMKAVSSDKLVIYAVRGYNDRETAETKFKGSTDKYGKVDSSDLTGIMYQKEERGLWIQTGSEAEGGRYIEIPRMNADVIGVGSVDASTSQGVKEGIARIKNALQIVSKARSDIGAQQNALEHVINNNNATVENTQAAESRIRDTDMAKEMVTLSLNNIIQEVGMTMMSQANQSTEGVLSLLS